MHTTPKAVTARDAHRDHQLRWLEVVRCPGTSQRDIGTTARNGTLTQDQAKNSPWRNVLYKFLGNAEMTEGADVHPFTPQAGDRLVMGSDGLTNFVTDADLREGALTHLNPQEWADFLVESALRRGSKDNVTCLVIHVC